MAVQQLMILCPKTGRAIPTGIAMDPASFASCGMQDNASSCPHCGQSHPWSKEHVFWKGESPN
jgi:hypothetical protein